MLLQQLRDSWHPGRRAQRVDSWRLAGACAVGAAACLACFAALEARIAEVADTRYAGVALTPLDLRVGYTASEAATLLAAYGHSGRLTYLALEALDSALYLNCYRALFLVLLNRATAVLAREAPAWSRSPLRAFSQAPLLVAALDLLENAGQVALTLAFDASNGAAAHASYWPALVAAASAANFAKWTLLRLVVPLMVLLFLAAAAVARSGRTHVHVQ
jgi:hypothetical protein